MDYYGSPDRIEMRLRPSYQLYSIQHPEVILLRQQLLKCRNRFMMDLKSLTPFFHRSWTLPLLSWTCTSHCFVISCHSSTPVTLHVTGLSRVDIDIGLNMTSLEQIDVKYSTPRLRPNSTLTWLAAQRLLSGTDDPGSSIGPERSIGAALANS